MMNTWTTKDGRVLDISEMDYNHILNCIKMLENKIKNGEIFEYSTFCNFMNPYECEQIDVSEEIKEQISYFKNELRLREIIKNEKNM